MEDAKARILQAATSLFSDNGFDGTSINEISQDAHVNKALIYYYFENKEAILDHLLKTLFDDLTTLSTDFVRERWVQLIVNKRMDIRSDGFYFSDRESLDYFMNSIDTYYEGLMDFLIGHRRVFRILVRESLKQGKHRHSLFRFVELINANEANPIYSMLHEADPDFYVSENTVVLKYFFGIMPLIGFAAYFDDWKALRNVSDQELRESLIKVSKALYMSANVSFEDLLFRWDLSSRE